MTRDMGLVGGRHNPDHNLNVSEESDWFSQCKDYFAGRWEGCTPTELEIESAPLEALTDEQLCRVMDDGHWDRPEPAQTKTHSASYEQELRSQSRADAMQMRKKQRRERMRKAEKADRKRNRRADRRLRKRR